MIFLKTDMANSSVIPTNREIMSPFNLSSIFVCGLCIFFIYADGTLVNDFFEQPQSIEAIDLPLAYHISEILYKSTTLYDFDTESPIIKETLCKSVLTTLNDSQGVETFRLTMARVQYLISNHNQDTQEIIISNIFTTMDLCLKQVSGKDFHSFQKELKNMIFENYKIPDDSSTSENFDVSMNFSDDFHADAHPEGISEESRSRSGHEFVPRDLEEVYTDVPTEEFDTPKPPRKKNRKYFDNSGSIGVHISSKEPKESLKRSDINVVKSGRKFFLFDDGLPKPAIDKDLSKKLFLFKGAKDGVDSHNSDGGTKEKGQKKHFLFDDNLPEMSFSNESQSKDKFSLGFDY